MIGRLIGTIAGGQDHTLLVDVNGVGYEVHCSQNTISDVSDAEGSVALFIETIVREDLIHLYGFATPEEKSCFQLVRSVQGVGNRMALSILSLFRPAELIHTLQMQDKTALTRADGVGPKLATRLVTELKDKVTSISVLPTAGRASVSLPTQRMHEGVISALVNLGYASSDASRVLLETLTDQPDLDDEPTLIKNCLQRLART